VDLSGAISVIGPPRITRLGVTITETKALVQA
jgi:hypothetical protein